MVSTMKKKRAAVDCKIKQYAQYNKKPQDDQQNKKEKAPPPPLLRLVGDVCSPPQKAGKPALWLRF